jgi:hypothetical protein
MTRSTPPLGVIWGPRLAKIEEGRLVPDWQRMLKRPAPRDLLARYCRIAESPDTDAAAARFARSWGVANLCDSHSLPIGHDTQCKGDPADSVRAHKDFARCLESLRNIGSALTRKHVGESVDWEIADAILCGEGFRPWSERERSVIRGEWLIARTHFQILMRCLLRVCRIQPRLYWSNGAWDVALDVLEGTNVPAILAAQLMLEVAGAKQQRKCRTCPSWFIPRGRQVYCGSLLYTMTCAPKIMKSCPSV